MIHQHIYAAAKPGMSEADFQNYWLKVHAVQFAMKIPQIAMYKLNLRLDCSIDTNPIWGGCAEIWLRNGEEQLASIQTPQFLQGARLDEPNWAAFWMTVGLDCDNHSIKSADVPASAVKLIVLSKRNLKNDVADYQKRRLAELTAGAASIPGLLKCQLALAVEGSYAIGESRFDEVSHFWFASLADAEAAFVSASRNVMLPKAADGLINPSQVYPMLVKEHWLIGPEERPLVQGA
jgi:hypothetical protein